MPRLPIKPVLRPVDTAVDPELDAIAAAQREEDEGNNVLGLITAAAKLELLRHNEMGEIRSDLSPPSFSANLTAITKHAVESAKHIPDRDLQDDWLAMVASENRAFANERAHQQKMDEVDKAFEQLGTVYVHPNTTEARREDIFRKMLATRELAKLAVGPSTAQQLGETHIGGAVRRGADALVWKNPGNSSATSHSNRRVRLRPPACRPRPPAPAIRNG